MQHEDRTLETTTYEEFQGEVKPYLYEWIFVYSRRITEGHSSATTADQCASTLSKVMTFPFDFHQFSPKRRSQLEKRKYNCFIVGNILFITLELKE